jgi:ceramide synthetase
MEAVYNSGNRYPSASEIHWLASELTMSDVSIATWFANRRKLDRPPLHFRFIEATRRALYFLTMQVLTFAILWDKSWLWDTRQCWLNYPNIHVPDSLFWLYMITIGSYLASAARLIVNRPWPADFTQKMTYHIIKLSLLGVSWSANLVRFGSLVLLCHDGSPDYFLEMSKVARYLGARRFGDFFFITGAALWFAIRLVFFPFYVLRSLLLESQLAFPIYIFSNTLAFAILSTHITRFIDMLGFAANKVFIAISDD